MFSNRVIGILLASYIIGILVRHNLIFLLAIIPLVCYFDKKFWLLQILLCCFGAVYYYPKEYRHYSGKVFYQTNNRSYIRSYANRFWVHDNRTLEVGGVYQLKISNNRLLESKLLRIEELNRIDVSRINLQKSLNRLPFTASIILGDNSMFSNEIAKLIKERGLWSLFISSGLYMTTVFKVVRFLVEKLLASSSEINYSLPRRSIRNFLIITTVIFYYFWSLSGWGSLRSMLVNMAKLFEPRQGKRALLIISFILLMYRPALLFDWGFQLSFLSCYLLQRGFQISPLFSLWFNNFNAISFIYFTMMKNVIYILAGLFLLSISIPSTLLITAKIEQLLKLILKLPTIPQLIINNSFLKIIAVLLFLSYMLEENKMWIYIIYLLLLISIFL